MCTCYIIVPVVYQLHNSTTASAPRHLSKMLPYNRLVLCSTGSVSTGVEHHGLAMQNGTFCVGLKQFKSVICEQEVSS